MGPVLPYVIRELAIMMVFIAEIRAGLLECPSKFFNELVTFVAATPSSTFIFITNSVLVQTFSGSNDLKYQPENWTVWLNNFDGHFAH